MDTHQAINRAYNLLGVSITSLAGFAFAPEMFLEKDVPDKIDDLLLFLLGLFAIWWYSRVRNRYGRTIIPIVFLVLALIIKVGAVIVEFDDAEAVGDDMGGLILFLLSLGLIAYQYVKTGKLLAALRG